MSIIHIHPAPPEQVCNAPQAVSNVITGFVLLMGAVVAFVPQYISIFLRKQSYGVERKTLALQLASAVFIVINV